MGARIRTKQKARDNNFFEYEYLDGEYGAYFDCAGLSVRARRSLHIDGYWTKVQTTSLIQLTSAIDLSNTANLIKPQYLKSFKQVITMLPNKLLLDMP